MIALIEQIGDIQNIHKASIVTGATFLIYVFKMVIDNWNLTELEKLKLSNFKKAKILLTKHSIFSLFSALITFLILSTSKNNNDSIIIIFSIICYVFFIIAMLVVEQIFKVINLILSFKYDYYVVDENGKQLYRIIKLSSNNKFQVVSERNEGVEGFVKVEDCIWYKKIRGENKIRSKIYNSKWLKWANICASTICILLFFPIFPADSWEQYILYLTLIFLIVIVMISWVNYFECKQLNAQQDNHENSLDNR